MRLTFIGKDPESNPTGSPTVYPHGTGFLGRAGCVEIPDRMIQFFRQGDRGVDNG